jgi:cobalamin-dependent methionine synthase I
MEKMVYIKGYNASEIDKKEVLRYARVAEADKETYALLDRCTQESKRLLSYKVCYSRFPIRAQGDDLDLGFAKVRSHSLATCLWECDEIILFCATIGVEFDRLIRKYSLTSPATAVMLQALGSERVEALCDEFCLQMAIESKRELRPRFSPGYGDLPLELQRDIFACLTPGKIGVSLGEGLFMTPSKSVTAIIGIKKEI